MTQFTQIPARMINDFVESFHACMAVLFTSKKGWRAWDVIAMTVVMQVKVFFCIRTRVNKGIQMFLGDDVELENFLTSGIPHAPRR